MRTSRAYVEQRLAEVSRGRKTWRKPGRRVLDHSHIRAARRRARAMRPSFTRITTRTWAGRA